MPTIVAVDPGVAPTVCLLIDDRGKQLAAEFHEGDDTSYTVPVGRVNRRRPSAPLLRQVLKQSFASLVVIEDVHSMPGQGVSSTFAFGFASGMVEGVATALGMRVLRVSPAVWRKGFRLGRGDTKAMSRHVASNLAPQLAHHFQHAKDHNKAEAFLMAYWARGQANADAA